MEEAVRRVFSTEGAVRNLEFEWRRRQTEPPLDMANECAYPVRTTPNQVRWVGIIVLDASERKRSEEALRRSEKLAVTGRLAASIAHEINNPLEAITNLLFLLRNFSELPEAGDAVRDDDRIRGAAHFGDHSADAALLPATDAARPHTHWPNCSIRC